MELVGLVIIPPNVIKHFIGYIIVVPGSECVLTGGKLMVGRDFREQVTLIGGGVGLCLVLVPLSLVGMAPGHIRDVGLAVVMQKFRVEVCGVIRAIGFRLGVGVARQGLGEILAADTGIVPDML
jgi:hypothetical protein